MHRICREQNISGCMKISCEVCRNNLLAMHCSIAYASLHNAAKTASANLSFINYKLSYQRRKTIRFKSTRCIVISVLLQFHANYCNIAITNDDVLPTEKLVGEFGALAGETWIKSVSPSNFPA